MNKYLNSLNKLPNSDLVKDVLLEAKELKTPIISDEGLSFLIQVIRIAKAKKVLEIGSAIGYSAIMMALNTDSIITTIERDEISYQRAFNNVKKAGLDGRINLIKGDALEVELNDMFDLIFIDAAKGQYLKFLDRFKNNLISGGVVICDNLLFHGMIENQDEIDSKRLKNLVKKIDDFNHKLIEHDDFESYIYEIGDGLSISIKKG